jgi:hypothetical protein
MPLNVCSAAICIVLIAQDDLERTSITCTCSLALRKSSLDLEQF